MIGYKDPLVQKVLAGTAPNVRAYQLVTGSKLGDAKRARVAFEQLVRTFGSSPFAEAARGQLTRLQSAEGQ